MTIDKTTKELWLELESAAQKECSCSVQEVFEMIERGELDGTLMKDGFEAYRELMSRDDETTEQIKVRIGIDEAYAEERLTWDFLPTDE